MSNEGTTGSNNQKKPPPLPNVVVNPYARTKRKDPPQPPQSSSSPTTTTTGAAKKPSIKSSSSSGKSGSNGTNKNIGNSNTNDYSLSAPMIGAVTFSQAFGSIDETPLFQAEQKRAYASGEGVSPQIAQAQAEQRALDQAEAEAAQQQQQASTMSDRDHHNLLQQPHVLYVSTRQRGNGVLKHIKNVPYAFSKMVPDYIMGTTSCALFLSLKYHHLYPDYIHRRIAELENMFKLRVLLALVDVDDNAAAILKLNKIAVTNSMTLILAWTELEAGRYLETYKALDGKDASSIQKREQTNFLDQVADFLTACKPVNKTDSMNLLDHFSNLRSVAAAGKDELALCPGLGHVKVNKLWDALHKPFSKRKAAERQKLKRQKLMEEEEEAKLKDQEQQEKLMNDDEDEDAGETELKKNS